MAGITSGKRFLDKTELEKRSAQAASGFHRLGVSEGDSIALILRNDFAFFEASMAAALIGAYVALTTVLQQHPRIYSPRSAVPFQDRNCPTEGNSIPQGDSDSCALRWRGASIGR
jgi:acyl-CoA synthetase (AMP-forming)/AMP-acid ligase II